MFLYVYLHVRAGVEIVDVVDASVEDDADVDSVADDVVAWLEEAVDVVEDVVYTDTVDDGDCVDVVAATDDVLGGLEDVVGRLVDVLEVEGDDVVEVVDGVMVVVVVVVGGIYSGKLLEHMGTGGSVVS